MRVMRRIDPGSSKGRTTGFGPVNGGSNPPSGTSFHDAHTSGFSRSHSWSLASRADARKRSSSPPVENPSNVRRSWPTPREASAVATTTSKSGAVAKAQPGPIRSRLSRRAQWGKPATRQMKLKLNPNACRLRDRDGDMEEGARLICGRRQRESLVHETAPSLVAKHDMYRHPKNLGPGGRSGTHRPRSCHKKVRMSRTSCSTTHAAMCMIQHGTTARAWTPVRPRWLLRRTSVPSIPFACEQTWWIKVRKSKVRQRLDAVHAGRPHGKRVPGARTTQPNERLLISLGAGNYAVSFGPPFEAQISSASMHERCSTASRRNFHVANNAALSHFVLADLKLRLDRRPGHFAAWPRESRKQLEAAFRAPMNDASITTRSTGFRKVCRGSRDERWSAP